MLSATLPDSAKRSTLRGWTNEVMVMKHPRTWYVVADGGRARILQKRDKEDMFDMIRELVSADLHHRTRELGSERPGRIRESASSAHHAVEPRQDLHRAEKRSFVHELAEALNEAGAGNEFDRLILVAPAHSLRTLHDGLDAATKPKVAAQLQKDLTNVPAAELAKHFTDLKDA
jgi:protein required for attachment to host cells